MLLFECFLKWLHYSAKTTQYPLPAFRPWQFNSEYRALTRFSFQLSTYPIGHGNDTVLSIKVGQVVLLRKAGASDQTLRGHLWLLHVCLWFAGPSLQQYCLPIVGGGLVHERKWLRIPPSQDLLHLVQAPHFEYPPWTKKERHFYGKRKHLAHYENKCLHKFVFSSFFCCLYFISTLFHENYASAFMCIPYLTRIKEPTACMKTCIGLMWLPFYILSLILGDSSIVWTFPTDWTYNCIEKSLKNE